MAKSAFTNPPLTNVPSARTLPQKVTTQFRGLDLVNPYDQIKEGRTPFAKNFRLYSEGSDSRRVAVSSRKGSGSYMNPLKEEKVYETGVDVTDILPVGIFSDRKAQKIIFPKTGRLTKVEFQVGAGENKGKGPLIVTLLSDNDGVPGDIITETSVSVIPTEISEVEARFIESPLIAAGDTYWIGFNIQDDGANVYNIATVNLDPEYPLLSGDGGWSAMTTTNSSAYIKIYLSPDLVDKGAFRFNQESASNKTVVVYDDTLYQIDIQNQQYLPVIDGLSKEATHYNFTVQDGKLFWVNSYDDLMTWDGRLESGWVQKITNPSFDISIDDWAGADSIVRDTSDYHTAPASGKVSSTKPAGTFRTARAYVNLEKHRRYKINFWLKAPINTEFELQMGAFTDESTDGILETFTTKSSDWEEYTFYFRGIVNTNEFRIRSKANIPTFWIDDVYIYETGIEVIKDPELPILSTVATHVNRLWGVSADDRNKIVWSQEPLNPTNNELRDQWYYQYRSVDFVYVPIPKAQDPITAIVSFQDNLVVFTATSKHNIYGSDVAQLQLRQAVSMQGAVSQQGVYLDRNLLYYVSTDGIYKYDGSKDINIAANVQSEFDGILDPRKMTISKYDRIIRVYYSVPGQSYNSRALLYHTDLDEIMLDTDVFTNRALLYEDGDETPQLIELSSQHPGMYLSEQQGSSLGKPIDFEYRLTYDSMGSPAQKKRIKKYFPLFEAVNNRFPVMVSMDKDLQDNPMTRTMWLSADGNFWGEFDWNDGTTWGGKSQFKPNRIRYPGYGYYWQLRIARRGVDNHVAFVGVQYNYKMKRL